MARFPIVSRTIGNEHRGSIRHETEDRRRVVAPAAIRTELQGMLTAAKELPSEELPRLLGELEEVRCTALARLTCAVPVQEHRDRLLNIAEAAARLGVSTDHLYRNGKSLPFARRMGKRLLFSELGIEKYIRAGKIY